MGLKFVWNDLLQDYEISLCISIFKPLLHSYIAKITFFIFKLFLDFPATITTHDTM